MVVGRVVLLLVFVVGLAAAWAIDGPSMVPEHEYARHHEANLFRQRLLSAFRSIDPKISESVMDRFTRYPKDY
ncbi:unnamed protein product [Caenorhabditis auriculariae]|uniref:Uncharacterized protein n=1 Tax=Caenorhabditis auriculariae TaxID=2777116 RepID=A0A8S1HTX2_9PELO|nr:unnamed protein product [Caenorhabditis auriculariae]